MIEIIGAISYFCYSGESTTVLRPRLQLADWVFPESLRHTSKELWEIDYEIGEAKVHFSKSFLQQTAGF